MDAADPRALWIDVLTRLADPVLRNLAQETLKARMPVEQGRDLDRRGVTHLEAVGRLMAGLAPWIELGAADTPEGRRCAEYGELARRALARGVDPASRDFLNFTDARAMQPLVDAAYLAQALVRAPRELAGRLDAATRANVVAALQSTRAIQPNFNTWLLFPAMVEAGLAALGADWDQLRVDYALRQHEHWYVGDGTYGDGPEFHWDYYNSFVIHPMLIDVLAVCQRHQPAWEDMAARVEVRARRYAAVLERLIAPDGSFPPLGRSLAYRVGAFHLLAQMALRNSLPGGVRPAQVRGALTAAIRRSLCAPGTFDADGWLRIGLCGHQPGIGEVYVSTGSLYACALGLLPLGLGPGDPFWSAPDEPWTSVRAWSGAQFDIDRALGH
jgi:hypothetical protein